MLQPAKVSEKEICKDEIKKKKDSSRSAARAATEAATLSPWFPQMLDWIGLLSFSLTAPGICTQSNPLTLVPVGPAAPAVVAFS